MVKAQPTGCLQENPKRNSIAFGGRFINLSHIARSQGMDLSYLSRIFACNREPTMPYVRAICAALGMSVDEFLEAMDERRALLLQAEMRVREEYLLRTLQEDTADLKKLEKGIPVPARLPGTRLPAEK